MTAKQSKIKNIDYSQNILYLSDRMNKFKSRVENNGHIRHQKPQ